MCRLVLKGMTQSEIAEAMGKSMSNIGTVRGNIRRKLGLSTDDDLRTALLMRVDGSNASAPPRSPDGHSKSGLLSPFSKKGLL